MSDANKKQHNFESATWKEIEKFLKDYEKWYAETQSDVNTDDSGGQPTPPPPPPPGGH